MSDVNRAGGVGRDRSREFHAVVDEQGGSPRADYPHQVVKHRGRQHLAEHPGGKPIRALLR
jgi:hypothetical protein